MNSEEYAAAARVKALASRSLYVQAYKKYGSLLLSMRGDAPIGLLVGHVLRVNPELSDAPPVKKDARRGFAKASYAEARTMDIPAERLDEPATCAYVIGREINRTATVLYTTHPALFATPNNLFWKCVYLAHTLGTSLFETTSNAAFSGVTASSAPVAIRDSRGRILSWEVPGATARNTPADLYTRIYYAVNSATTAPVGYRTGEYKKLVLMDCEYVYNIWNLFGGGEPRGFGRLPVLSNSQTQAILHRNR